MFAMRRLITGLVAFMVLPIMSAAIASGAPPKVASAALAIEVGSHTTRTSAIIISLGPGAQSLPRPLDSLWTAEGFLSIKDGTDEALYVHPFNTYFNLEHPVAFIAKNLSENRPNITGYRTFTLSDITEKYLKRSLTSAETIIGRGIGSFNVVMPGGNEFSENRWHVVDYASPTAAVRRVRQSHKSIAAAFEIDTAMEDERTALVYRLGSSTLEVSVFLTDEGIYDKLSSIYDQHLGGNDFNKRVVKHLLLAHKKKTLQDLSSDHKFIMRLEREVEKAKQALSYQNSVRIEIQSFHPGGQDFFQELTRSRFVDLNMDLFTKSIAAVDQAIRDAN